MPAHIPIMMPLVMQLAVCTIRPHENLSLLWWLIHGFPFPSVLFHRPQHGLGISQNGTPAAEEGHGHHVKEANLHHKSSLPCLLSYTVESNGAKCSGQG